MQIKRHLGRLINTDRKIVVVFMRIPDRPDHALVVDTDALPDYYHDGLMDVVESLEGQQTPVLADILARRMLPGSGMSILQALHTVGRLQPMPIDNIKMLPRPNHPIKLADLLRMMDQTPEEAKAEVDERRATRFAENASIEEKANAERIAANLLQQAAALKNEAKLKEEEAYRVAPHLRERFDEVVENEFIPSVSVDFDDLPPVEAIDVLNELKAAMGSDVQVVDELDEQTQAFLDRVAAREDKAAKTTEPVAKRPVGRPKKNAG